MQNKERFELDMLEMVTPKYLRHIKSNKPEVYQACYNQWKRAALVSQETGVPVVNILMEGTLFMAFAAKPVVATNVINLAERRLH